jgi:DNA-binding MarR family transcriptional regulator
MENLSLSGYRSLAELRYQIRRFLRFSEENARKASVEPRQHQLLLAIKGLPRGVRPRIAVLAERLQLQHHSTVELANRLAQRGYIRRRRDTDDRREVLLDLTARGEKLLRELSLDHRQELRRAGPALMKALQSLVDARRHGTAHKSQSRLLDGEKQRKGR